MISAVVIDYLNQTTTPGDTGVGYLFCNHKAQSEQRAPALLAVLLKQLIQTRPALIKSLGKIMESCRGCAASVDHVYTALKSTCGSYKNVYLIIDALDEYDDKDNTRSLWIDQLLDLQRETGVRILFTSRAIPTIVEKFQHLPTLEVRAHGEDVRMFVCGKLPRLPRCIQHNKELQNTIVTTITEAADGM